MEQKYYSGSLFSSLLHVFGRDVNQCKQITINLLLSCFWNPLFTMMMNGLTMYMSHDITCNPCILTYLLTSFTCFSSVTYWAITEGTIWNRNTVPTIFTWVSCAASYWRKIRNSDWFLRCEIGMYFEFHVFV